MVERTGSSGKGAKKTGRVSPAQRGKKPVTIDLEPDGVKDVTPDEKAAAKPESAKSDAKSDAKSGAGAAAADQTAPAKPEAEKAEAQTPPADAASKSAGKTGGEDAGSSGPAPSDTAEKKATEEKVSKDKPAEDKPDAREAAPKSSDPAEKDIPAAAATAVVPEPQRPGYTPGLIAIGVAACLGGLIALAGQQILRNYGIVSDPSAEQLTVFSGQIEELNTALREQAESGPSTADLEATLSSLRADLDQSEALLGLETRVSALEPVVSGFTEDLETVRREAPAAATALQDEISGIATDLARLEDQIAGLRATPSAPSGEPAASVEPEIADTALDEMRASLADLAARLESLASAGEDAGARIDAAETATQTAAADIARLNESVERSTSEVAGLQNRLDGMAEESGRIVSTLTSVNDAIDSLSSRTELFAAQIPADLGTLSRSVDEKEAALSDRIGEVVSSVSAFSGRLAEVEKTPPDSRIIAASRVAAVNALARAIESEGPYAAELGIALELGISDDLNKLAAFGDDGLPSLASLQKIYSDEVHDRLFAALPSGETTNRLLANAFSLVSRDGVALSGEAPQVLVALSAAVADGNIAKSLEAFAALPPEAQEAGETWQRQLQLHGLAKTLLPDLSRQTLSALSGTNG